MREVRSDGVRSEEGSTLPLEDTLNQLTLRRRRAQIAARKALELR